MQIDLFPSPEKCGKSAEKCGKASALLLLPLVEMGTAEGRTSPSPKCGEVRSVPISTRLEGRP